MNIKTTLSIKTATSVKTAINESIANGEQVLCTATSQEAAISEIEAIEPDSNCWDWLPSGVGCGMLAWGMDPVNSAQTWSIQVYFNPEA